MQDNVEKERHVRAQIGTVAPFELQSPQLPPHLTFPFCLLFFDLLFLCRPPPPARVTSRKSEKYTHTSVCPGRLEGKDSSPLKEQMSPSYLASIRFSPPSGLARLLALQDIDRPGKKGLLASSLPFTGPLAAGRGPPVCCAARRVNS